jgi:hypothetical protein
MVMPKTVTVGARVAKCESQSPYVRCQSRCYSGKSGGIVSVEPVLAKITRPKKHTRVSRGRRVATVSPALARLTLAHSADAVEAGIDKDRSDANPDT